MNRYLQGSGDGCGRRSARREFGRGVDGRERALNALDIFQLLKTPELRVADKPWMLHAGALLVQNPDDPYLQELFSLGVDAQVRAAVETCDPLYPNYPGLAEHLDFDIGILELPDGRLFGIPFEACFRNIGIPGPTGTGKSSVLRLVLSQVALRARVVLIDRKRSLRELAGLPILGEYWLVLPWTSLKLALLQAPTGVPREVWASELVSLIARSYSLYASQRPMLELLHKAYSADGAQANPESWERQVRGWQCGRGFREQGYKEAMLWTLVNLRQSVPVFNFAKSNLLELLFSERGGVVVEVDSLPTEHYAFFVSYLLRWIYLRRLHAS